MKSVSKVGDILIMKNGERYVVLDCVEYEDEMYLKVSGVIENENKQEYVSGFVKEIISEDEKYSLEIVDNKKLVDTLNSIMIEVMEKEKESKDDDSNKTKTDKK